MTAENSLGLTVSETQTLLRGSAEMRDADRDRIDLLQDNISDLLKRHDDQLADHEKRIRSTEKFTWQATAILAAAIALWDIVKGLLK